MEKDARIFVAGAGGLKGAALVRQLAQRDHRGVISEREPDLTNPEAVEAFFASVRPQYVFAVAGRSAGIAGNQQHAAELIRDNLLISAHLIDSAYRHRTKKLLYLGSSCIYPKHCAQPMRVESILTGSLEPTSEAYAVAKIAGLKMCQAYRRQYGVDFITAIPADAFGPGDNFRLEDSHAAAALIRRMHDAKESGAAAIDIWGSGRQRREFIFADDLADACLFAMEHYDGLDPINLGGGTDLSIEELANHIRDVVGFQGSLNFDTSKPDGMPLKLLDSAPLFGLGWRPRTALLDGLRQTYQWFLQHHAHSVGGVSTKGQGPGIRGQ